MRGRVLLCNFQHAQLGSFWRRIDKVVCVWKFSLILTKTWLVGLDNTAERAIFVERECFSNTKWNKMFSLNFFLLSVTNAHAMIQVLLLMLKKRGVWTSMNATRITAVVDRRNVKTTTAAILVNVQLDISLTRCKLSIYLSIPISIYLSIYLSIYTYIYTHTHTHNQITTLGRTVFKWLLKVIMRLGLLGLQLGYKISCQYFNRWEARPKPIESCTRDYFRVLSKLRVIAGNSDCRVHRAVFSCCDWSE